MEEENIKEILLQRRYMKFRLIVLGLVIGIITGIVIVLNRLAITKFSYIFNNLLEFVVEMGSIVEGKQISEVNWPKDCLLVSIKRGEKEIIPRGYVKIENGDYIVALVNIDKRANVIEEVNKLTLV